jgi:hypothetical protein
MEKLTMEEAAQIKEEADARDRLQREYGEVWNTREVQEEFEVLSFMAPFCFVRRRSDYKTGTVQFEHMPRFYFNFCPDGRS